MRDQRKPYVGAFLDGVERGDIILNEEQGTMSPRPGVVVLCGSSRFVDKMAVLAWEIERGGWIVLSMHFLPRWYTYKDPDRDRDHPDLEYRVRVHHQAEAEGIKDHMDELHKRKIDLADRVLVCDFTIEGVPYFGESTTSEIAYARAHGKPVEYISKGPGVVG